MTLPPILTAGRAFVVGRLVCYGLAQAASGFGLARLVHHALAGKAFGEILWSIPAIIGVLTAGRIALRICESRDAEMLGQQYAISVRERILDSIASTAGNEAAERRWGVTMSRLITDLNSLRNWVSLGLAKIISGAVTVAGLIAGLLWIYPLIGMLLGGVCLLTIGWGALVTPALRLRVRAARKERGRLINSVAEQMMAGTAPGLFGRLERDREQILHRARKLQEAMISRAKIASFLRSGPEFAHGLALIVIVCAFASSQAERSSRPAAMILLLGLILSALRDLARAWDYRISYEQGRTRINEYLKHFNLLPAAEPREALRRAPEIIRFIDVPLGAQQIPFNGDVRKGEIVIITGESGSGKTALLHSAAMLLPLKSGRITINGAALPNIRDLHRVVQLVSADVPLRRGSVAQNISYVNPQASRADIETAARICGIVENRELFPEGLETRVREGGRYLTSGARARVALARAVLLEPTFLMVDDPAFLANASAMAVLKQAHEFLGGALLLVATPPWPLDPDQVWSLPQKREDDVRRGSLLLQEGGQIALRA